MAIKKENISVFVSTTVVDTYPADVDFTTEAIEFKDINGFTLDIWFPTLVGTSPAPTLEIQCSNSTDSASFTTYNDFIGFSLPDYFEKSEVKPNYIRFVYTATGVSATSTVTFKFNKLIEVGE